MGIYHEQNCLSTTVQKVYIPCPTSNLVHIMALYSDLTRPLSLNKRGG